MNLKEKLSKVKKKLIMGVGVFLILLLKNINVLADVNSGLSTAKNNVLGQLKPAINGTVVPILLVLLVGAILVAIVYAVYSYRKGRDVELGWIIALLIGIIFVATFSTWGWQLIG